MFPIGEALVVEPGHPFEGGELDASRERHGLRRHVTSTRQPERDAAVMPNQRWLIDLVSDALFDGRRIRALTLVDNFTREALAIVVDGSIRVEHVVEAVERIASQRGPPQRIRADDGSEFVSKVLTRWAYENDVTLDFSRPGKPTDNCLMESFNGRLRNECLDTHWFLSLEDARSKIEAWRRDYNASRPHSALGHLTPLKFAAQAAGNGA
jgi:putative transposase